MRKVISDAHLTEGLLPAAMLGARSNSVIDIEAICKDVLYLLDAERDGWQLMKKLERSHQMMQEFGYCPPFTIERTKDRVDVISNIGIRRVSRLVLRRFPAPDVTHGMDEQERIRAQFIARAGGMWEEWRQLEAARVDLRWSIEGFVESLSLHSAACNAIEPEHAFEVKYLRDHRTAVRAPSRPVVATAYWQRLSEEERSAFLEKEGLAWNAEAEAIEMISKKMENLWQKHRKGTDRRKAFRP